MKNLIRPCLAVVTGLLVLTEKFASAAENPFLGNWALTLPGGYVGWLGITQEKDYLDGAMLWRWGSVTPLDSVFLNDKALVFTQVREVQRKNDAGKVVRTHRFTDRFVAQVQGDTLSIVAFRPHPDGSGVDREELKGKRISPLPPAPDLAKVKFREPVKLFNGKDLTGWKISDFAAQGGVEVETDFRGQGPAIVIQLGEVLSGVTYTNPVPRVDYEITLETMKLDGSDFFVGLTFPYRTNHATFVCGGWGGGVVGISSIDGADASENESTKFVGFEKNKWYRVKVRVTADRIEAWLDDEQVANIETAGKKIDMRPGEIENAVPLSLSTYQTSAACRNVVLRKLTPAK